MAEFKKDQIVYFIKYALTTGYSRRRVVRDLGTSVVEVETIGNECRPRCIDRKDLAVDAAERDAKIVNMAANKINRLERQIERIKSTLADILD